MSLIYAPGVTSKSLTVLIVDDSGLPVTGLVAATFPSVSYQVAGPNAAVAFPALSDLATITTAWAAGGVKELSVGEYRLDCPDAMFTAAGKVKVFAEAAGKHLLIEIVDVSYPQVDARQWLGGTIPAVNVTGVPLVDLKYTLGTLSAGAAGYVGPDWGHVNAPTTTLDLSGTTIKNLDGNTVQTGDSYAYLGTNLGALGANATALASATNLAEANADLDELIVTIGVAGAGLTNIVLPSGGLANVTAWTVAITGNITGNLSGSVGSVTGLTTATIWASAARTLTAATNITSDGSAIGVTSGVVNEVAQADNVVELGGSVPVHTGGRLWVLDGSGNAVGTAANQATIIADVAASAPQSGDSYAYITGALTESYAAEHATGTMAQLLYMIYSAVQQFDISTTTLTCRKLDGTTSSMVVTLNDATNPTGRVRSS